MPACEHALTARVSPPSSSTAVYKEECTQCFDNYDMEAGIDVCLTCFNGGCTNEHRQHAQQHALKTGHHLAVTIKRTKKPAPAPSTGSASEDGQRPAKLTKLEIKEDSDDQYEATSSVRCWACGGRHVDTQATAGLAATVLAVVHAAEARQAGEIKAWAEEVTGCEHFEGIEQQAHGGFSLEGLHKCGSCDKTDNLWLCLGCGHVGCGRRQYDGSGGNNHAVEHFEKTRHGVSVKLGTITPEGTADAYCYVCDDNRLDGHLSQHLQAFGISVAAQQKTEKSVAELQLEQNLKFDFSMTTADGAQLLPVAGPGLTGLKNLGNSCYMASIIQCVFAIDRFRDRYFPTAADHFATCMQERPAQCLQCQVHKLAHGLWSGVYAHIEKDADGNVTQQTGVPPAQFKAAISKDHYEFSTMRQQDAFEFWQFLVKQIGVMERRASASGESTGSDPSHVFDFKTEERLQCLECNKVRYTVQPASSVSLPVPKRVSADGTLETVSLQECLEMLAGTETIDGYSCPECCRPTKAAKSTRFASFPRVLAVQARRFELVNWVPQKLDIPLAVPLAAVDLEQYRARGIQPDEQPLPEDSAGQTAASALAAEPTVADEPSAEDVAQLESMGFPRVRCIKALRKTANVEAALNWIFEHMDDPTIDVPDEPQQPSQQQQLTVDPETVAMLTSMGFAADRVERALASADGNAERALDRLLSGADELPVEAQAVGATNKQEEEGDVTGVYELTGFVSHKGSSVHCGHYVASVRHGLDASAKWYLFNDEKVVEQPEPQPEQAYVYFFTRTE